MNVRVLKNSFKHSSQLSLFQGNAQGWYLLSVVVQVSSGVPVWRFRWWMILSVFLGMSCVCSPPLSVCYSFQCLEDVIDMGCQWELVLSCWTCIEFTSLCWPCLSWLLCDRFRTCVKLWEEALRQAAGLTEYLWLVPEWFGTGSFVKVGVILPLVCLEYNQNR